MSDGTGPAQHGLCDIETRPETQRARRHSEKGRSSLRTAHKRRLTTENDPVLFVYGVKLRYYRANQAIMEKASMLYNRFKNTYLVGEGEEVVSASFLRSLLEEKEREEAQRAEHCREKVMKEELLQEVKRGEGHVKDRRRMDTEGGGGEGGETRKEEAIKGGKPVNKRLF